MGVHSRRPGLELTVEEESSPACDLAAHLVFEVEDDAVLAVQVAAASTRRPLRHEQLDVSLDGRPIESPMEVATSRGGRVHILRAREGTLDVRYSATVARTTMQPSPVDVPGIELVHDEESLEALRQSRYCPSDRLAGFADFEFADVPRGPDLPSAVAAWVFERIAYRSGVSDHLDTAVETLVAGEGVCRDFAHLTISLCRALRVPARFVAVYAPGLSPMDFHAVAEARIGAGWEIVDPTRCAPRSSLVRVATGRDAADTAFATTLRGRAALIQCEVTAVVEGDLPADDHRSRAFLD
ncbi:MAG: transglutaminase family protein [Acidimicrobiales bacterium]